MMRYTLPTDATSNEGPTISAEASTRGQSGYVPNRIQPELGRVRECCERRLRAYRDLAHTFVPRSWSDLSVDTAIRVRPMPGFTQRLNLDMCAPFARTSAA